MHARCGTFSSWNPPALIAAYDLTQTALRTRHAPPHVTEIGAENVFLEARSALTRTTRMEIQQRSHQAILERSEEHYLSPWYRWRRQRLRPGQGGSGGHFHGDYQGPSDRG